MMTDDIEDIIRDAKPGTSHRTDPVGETALRLLESIRAERLQHVRSGRQESAHRRRRFVGRTRISLVTSTVAALLMIVAFTLTMLQPTAPAQAATPDLLRTTAVSKNAREVAEELSQVRAQATDTATRTIRLNEWSLHSYVNDKGEIESSDIEPQWRELTFHPDGTIRFRLVAGEPFAGQDTTSLPEPGTVLEDTTYDDTNPFEQRDTYQSEPPTDPALMGDYLARTLGVENPTTAEYFNAITGVLSNRPVTAEQEATMLKFIATLADIRVDGSTTDRLDRPGVVLRTQNGEYAQLLVVSPKTGKFLAAETVYVGSSRNDISSPAVTSYIAWER